jgi:hypothetical protein
MTRLGSISTTTGILLALCEGCFTAETADPGKRPGSSGHAGNVDAGTAGVAAGGAGVTSGKALGGHTNAGAGDFTGGRMPSTGGIEASGGSPAEEGGGGASGAVPFVVCEAGATRECLGPARCLGAQACRMPHRRRAGLRVQ